MEKVERVLMAERLREMNKKVDDIALSLLASSASGLTIGEASNVYHLMRRLMKVLAEVEHTASYLVG